MKGEPIRITFASAIDLQILDAVLIKGEPFIIAKSGKPKVQVIQLDKPTKTSAKRRIGSLEGLYKIPDDFEEIDKQLDKEIEELMLGNEEK